MLAYVQGVRKSAGAVLFSVLLLFGIISPNVLAADSQTVAKENMAYTIKVGDTLYRIALRYGVTVQQLVVANTIANPNLIFSGQQILVLVSKASTASLPIDDTYRINAGDTLYGIALRYGVTVQQLVKINTIADPNLIYVGQILTMPLTYRFTQQEVLSAGWNEAGQGDVWNWADIVFVSAGAYHTVGLKKDGTTVATGSNLNGESDVWTWTDIVAISAGISHTVGLKSDGTAIATGNNANGEGNVQDWIDIVAVSAGNGFTLGLKADGTVVVAGGDSYNQGDVSGCTDVIAVAAGSHHTVGLKSDGTVIATGYNQDGQCDVSGWKDMIAVSAGGNTFGLRKDGTVAVAGGNVWNQYDALGWTDIGQQ